MECRPGHSCLTVVASTVIATFQIANLKRSPQVNEQLTSLHPQGIRLKLLNLGDATPRLSTAICTGRNLCVLSLSIICVLQGLKKALWVSKFVRPAIA